MNKLTIIASLATALLIGCSSCNRYLDIQPNGKTIPKTADEFASLLHDHLNDLDAGDANYLLGNAAILNDWDGAFGDDFEVSLSKQGASTLKAYIGDYVKTSLAYTPYRLNYEIIRNCNICIDGLSERSTTEGREVLATAYTMRAVAYYQLMRLYAPAPQAGSMATQLGVPLVTTFDLEHYQPRASLLSTAQQIEQDLQTAISYHSTRAVYRFTEDVAKGYLARLYFWTQQWDKALPLAQALVEKYPLVSGDRYREMQTTAGTLKGNQLIKAYRITTSDLPYSTAKAALQNRPISKRFVDAFPSDERSHDIRYSLWMNTKRIVQKNYFCGMRSAEMQLIKAECLAHLGRSAEALAALNELRQHRLDNYTAWTEDALPTPATSELITTDATGKPLSQLLSAILRERRKELFLEGDRFFELKRCGSPRFATIYNALNYTTEPYMYTLPIPPVEVVGAHLEQNPGYTDIVTE